MGHGFQPDLQKGIPFLLRPHKAIEALKRKGIPF